MKEHTFIYKYICAQALELPQSHSGGDDRNGTLDFSFLCAFITLFT